MTVTRCTRRYKAVHVSGENTTQSPCTHKLSTANQLEPPPPASFPHYQRPASRTSLPVPHTSRDLPPCPRTLTRVAMDPPVTSSIQVAGLYPEGSSGVPEKHTRGRGRGALGVGRNEGRQGVTATHIYMHQKKQEGRGALVSCRLKQFPPAAHYSALLCSLPPILSTWYAAKVVNEGGAVAAQLPKVGDAAATLDQEEHVKCLRRRGGRAISMPPPQMPAGREVRPTHACC